MKTPKATEVARPSRTQTRRHDNPAQLAAAPGARVSSSHPGLGAPSPAPSHLLHRAHPAAAPRYKLLLVPASVPPSFRILPVFVQTPPPHRGVVHTPFRAYFPQVILLLCLFFTTHSLPADGKTHEDEACPTLLHSFLVLGAAPALQRH